jgi:hypothetical protein
MVDPRHSDSRRSFFESFQGLIFGDVLHPLTTINATLNQLLPLGLHFRFAKPLDRRTSLAGIALEDGHLSLEQRGTSADQLTAWERETASIRSLRSGETERFMRAAAVLRPMSARHRGCFENECALYFRRSRPCAT